MSEPQKRRRGRPRGAAMKPEQTTVQALDRGLTILRTLAASEGLSLTELAAASEQAPATVFRVLATLEAHGFVETDPARQLWFIGAEAFRIGSAFVGRSNLVERGRPVLRDLMVLTGETANLAIADREEVVFVSQVETHEPIRAFFRPGSRSAFHASGIGKAMMAHGHPRISGQGNPRPLRRAGAAWRPGLSAPNRRLPRPRAWRQCLGRQGADPCRRPRVPQAASSSAATSMRSPPSPPPCSASSSSPSRPTPTASRLPPLGRSRDRHRAEMYLGFVLDRKSERIMIVASAHGGMEIEDLADDRPRQPARMTIDPAVGLTEFQARELAFQLGLKGGQVGQMVTSCGLLPRLPRP
jgi:hypothetical protein